MARVMTTTPPALPRRRPGPESEQRPEPVPGTCPACGARVRPTQPWCSLCHHRLGAATTQDREPEPEPEPVQDPEPVPEPAPQPVVPETARPAGERIAALRVEAMLVELAAVEHRPAVPPALARLVGSGPLGKVALGGGALVGLLVLLVAGFSLLGLFV